MGRPIDAHSWSVGAYTYLVSVNDHDLHTSVVTNHSVSAPHPCDYCNVSNTGSLGSPARNRDAKHTRSHRQVSLRCNGLCPSCAVLLALVTYILQDTEFPGVVARPIGSFKTSSDYHYQTMRCNVDLLKIIQVGITLADEDGNYPQDVSTWQFNFRFSVKCVANCVTAPGCSNSGPATTCTLRTQSSCYRNPALTCSGTRRWE